MGLGHFSCGGSKDRAQDVVGLNPGNMLYGLDAVAGDASPNRFAMLIAAVMIAPTGVANDFGYAHVIHAGFAKDRALNFFALRVTN